MKFHKINSYTWIQPTGKKSIDEIKKLIDEKSLTKTDRFMESRSTDEKQSPDYEAFCSKVFRERKFIPQIEFHRMIAENFNTNVTFYRQRMEAKGLIKVENRIVYKIE